MSKETGLLELILISHQVSIDDKITISLFVVGDTEYYLLPEKFFIYQIRRSNHSAVDFPTEIILTFDGINKTIYSVSPYYINGEIKTGKHNIQDLDQIVFWNKVSVSFIQKQILSIHSLFSIETSLLPFSEVSTEDRSKEFHRSPRIILRKVDDK